VNKSNERSEQTKIKRHSDECTTGSPADQNDQPSMEVIAMPAEADTKLLVPIATHASHASSRTPKRSSYELLCSLGDPPVCFKVHATHTMGMVVSEPRCK
jgi:hypothetical protein